MSDPTGAKDPGAIWRDQPEEELQVNLEQIVNRRTEELSSSTRSEILMSIGAALLFVGVVAWRLAPERRAERLRERSSTKSAREWGLGVRRPKSAPG